MPVNTKALSRKPATLLYLLLPEHEAPFCIYTMASLQCLSRQRNLSQFHSRPPWAMQEQYKSSLTASECWTPPSPASPWRAHDVQFPPPYVMRTSSSQEWWPLCRCVTQESAPQSWQLHHLSLFQGWQCLGRAWDNTTGMDEDWGRDD